MRNINRLGSMKKIILTIFISIIMGQEQYPADSLFKSDNVSSIKKFFIYPITRWQRISNKSDIFNCQFYPSCSNFCVKSINKKGVIKGSIIAADRIIRCNPAALYYHLELNGVYNDEDGRLIDFVDPTIYQKNKKSPTFAAVLSIVPGLGRLYSGRFYDGIYSIITLALTGNATAIAINNNRKILAPAFGATFIVLYVAEIYGGWRAAKYYQTAKKQKKKTKE